MAEEGLRLFQETRPFRNSLCPFCNSQMMLYEGTEMEKRYSGSGIVEENEKAGVGFAKQAEGFYNPFLFSTLWCPVCGRVFPAEVEDYSDTYL